MSTMRNRRSLLLTSFLARDHEVGCLVLLQGIEAVQDGSTVFVLVVPWALASLSPFLHHIHGKAEDDCGTEGADQRVVVDELLEIRRFDVEEARKHDPDTSGTVSRGLLVGPAFQNRRRGIGVGPRARVGGTVGGLAGRRAAVPRIRCGSHEAAPYLRAWSRGARSYALPTRNVGAGSAIKRLPLLLISAACLMRRT